MDWTSNPVRYRPGGVLYLKALFMNKLFLCFIITIAVCAYSAYDIHQMVKVALIPPRDYQIDIHNDSNFLYYQRQYLGFTTYHGNGIDSILRADNY